MTGPPVELALFDLLDEYSAAIVAGEVTSGRRVATSSKIIIFLQSFFEQLFASCFALQLEAFDDESKRMSVELRHGRDVTEKLRPVVSAFEEVCDLYPDIIGASYGGGSEATFRRFHKRYLPRLLRSAAAWANGADERDLAARITESAQAYNSAIGAAKW
jgi:hypothetical protein